MFKKNPKRNKIILKYCDWFGMIPAGMALLFSGLVMMGHFMIIPLINPYMEFNNGYPKSVTPMIYLIGGSAFICCGKCTGMGSRSLRKIAGIHVLCISVRIAGVCYNQCSGNSFSIYTRVIRFLVRLFNRQGRNGPGNDQQCGGTPKSVEAL
jgi:predicted MFS family arabinose efflux permease